MGIVGGLAGIWLLVSPAATSTTVAKGAFATREGCEWGRKLAIVQEPFIRYECKYEAFRRPGKDT